MNLRKELEAVCIPDSLKTYGVLCVPIVDALKIIKIHLREIRAKRVDLTNLLLDSHRLIQEAIYSDEGIDGGEGQEYLDNLEKVIKVEKPHRETNSPET